MRREANLWRGAVYISLIPDEGGFQPIVCCQPAKSGESLFLAVSPGLFLAVSLGLFLAVSPGLFLAESPGLFSGCVARVVFWLCRQGCFLAVSPGLFSGCFARVVFWLCRQGCCWLCRQVCSLTVLSGISFVGSIPGYPGCVIKGLSRAVITSYRAAQPLREPVKFLLLVLEVRYKVYECTGQESLRLKGKSRRLFKSFPIIGS